MRQRDLWLIRLALALVTIGVYVPVIRFGFISYDDPEYIVNNRIVQQGITTHGIRWAMTTGAVSNWHPLTWMSHMLDCQLFGANAAAHHAVNVAFHVINTLLLSELLMRLTGAAWRSALVAALFALHPLHVESVAWVSERKDVLSTCLFLLTLLAYDAYVRRRSAGWYAATLALFAAGLMAKPMLVTVPGVLMLLDYWPLRRMKSMRDFRIRLVEKIPFIALAIASSVITFLVQRHGGSVASIQRIGIPLRLANVLVAYARYLGKTIWPAD